MSNLTVIEQKEVEFYDDYITAVTLEDGNIYASVRHMCQALGLDPQGQTQRIDRHTVLSEGKGVCKIHTPSIGERGGGYQRVIVLRVDLVPLWLSGIRTKSVSAEMRSKLERFQREAAKVLWEAFQHGRLTVDPTFSELLKRDTEAVEAYKMIAAMLKLARNQVLIESRLDDHEGRLESLESQLNDPQTAVTQDEAMQISQAVKTVAIAIGKESKRNEFGAVYGELYRYFGITSYKQLPRSRFQECINWLNAWYQDVTGNPF